IAYTIYQLNKLKKLNCTLFCVSLHGPNKDISLLSQQDSHIKPIQMDLSKNFKFNQPVDFIMHAACYAQPQKFIENSLATIELNITSTRKLLELAKKYHARFMFFSSAEVYGDIPKDLIPVPETYNGNASTTTPRAVYGESKRLAETLCSIYRRDYNLQAYAVRISHVYGPGISKSDKRVLGDFIRKAMDESKIALMDRGTAIKTFGYVADIIVMLFTILLHGKDLIYNVGGIDSVSIRQLADAVAAYYNIPVIVPEKPAKLLHIGTDPAIVKLDLTKYTKEFNPVAFISLEEGIRRMIDWNREALRT
ncbi:NAD-dependent epimerase/dehydratase family protein, partial [Candidatus Roizmanbacteria bacterium]|nr:NAD-dependent epimerase/dehydratase family protein [Candidatus Roizmanbacteria bacterium]